MRSIAIAVTLVVLGTQTSAAQVIRGWTLDASNRALVPSTVVVLLSAEGDSIGTVISSREAFFRMELPAPGRYSLRAERIGFTAVTTPEVNVASREEVTVEVLLGADPVELDPLTVTSRRGGESGSVAAHRRRVDWIQRTGIGKVITRQEIENRPRPFVSDYLYAVSGLRVMGTGPTARVVMRGCAPSIFLDGVRAPGLGINTVSPDAIEGIEIYRSVSEVPAELRTAGSCGALAVWTRPGERTPGRWTLLQKIFAATGGAALITLMFTQF